MNPYLDPPKEKPLNKSLKDKIAPQNTGLLQTVFDTFDEPLYIVNLENDKIIFANKKLEALFGPVIGKLCWQKIQKGQTGPCTFCTNHYLLDKDGHPTGVHHSLYHNSLVDKWFQCSDQAFEWSDGRMVAIKTSTDVTALQKSILSQNELLKKNETLTHQILTSIDNERKQLSQSLHDNAGQICTAIKLNAEFLAAKTDEAKTSRDQIDAIDDIINLSSQFLKIIQDTSTLLNPCGTGICQTAVEGLQSMFDTWLARNRAISGQMTSNLDPDLELNPLLKEPLCWVMQEALTNISRHSKATQVNVILCVDKTCSKVQEHSQQNRQERKNCTATVINLTIADNGVGFPDKLSDDCLGLTYMAARVALFGGAVQRGVSALGGAQLFIQLPIQPPLNTKRVKNDPHSNCR